MYILQRQHLHQTLYRHRSNNGGGTGVKGSKFKLPQKKTTNFTMNVGFCICQSFIFVRKIGNAFSVLQNNKKMRPSLNVEKSQTGHWQNSYLLTKVLMSDFCKSRLQLTNNSPEIYFKPDIDEYLNIFDTQDISN